MALCLQGKTITEDISLSFCSSHSLFLLTSFVWVLACSFFSRWPRKVPPRIHFRHHRDMVGSKVNSSTTTAAAAVWLVDKEGQSHVRKRLQAGRSLSRRSCVTQCCSGMNQVLLFTICLQSPSLTLFLSVFLSHTRTHTWGDAWQTL